MGPPSKKRKLKESATEEVVFDPSARFDYLTGFHKRKVQRTKHAQEIAARRAREERIDARKKLRDERKADLEQHVKEVNALLAPSRPPDPESDQDSQSSDHPEGWNGLLDAPLEPVDHEEEYIDEDKYTTVVVEEVDITKDGISKTRGEDDRAEKKAEASSEARTDKEELYPASSRKSRLKDKKPKKKKKNFRYESPADRKQNRVKERARKSKAAKARRGE